MTETARNPLLTEVSPAPKNVAQITEPIGPHPVSPETALSRKSYRVSRAYLINKLNYINFMNGAIDVILSHRRYDRKVCCKALPQPCEGERLQCRWQEPERVAGFIHSYRFEHFFLTDGVKALLVEPTFCHMDEAGIQFDLPERCFEIRNRREVRYPCRNTSVQVIQNSMLFKGELLEFSTASLRVELVVEPPQTFEYIDARMPLGMIATINDEMVYSGNFTILKQGRGQRSRIFILEPQRDALHRFNPRTFRSTRMRLVPSPNLLFKHPLTGNMVNLKVVDISGSGFSVTERVGGSLLLPGLILPEVELSFAGILHIRFKAQVVHRNLSEDEDRKGEAVCGVAILDMESREHLKLLSILHQAENEKSYINNEVEMDALWDFFFETGFIYPKKYRYIEENKEEIKAVYWKLYTQNPTIARHFIYQDKGRILGHMAMVRLYENAWLIHHHAARKRDQIQAGISVLHQIGRFGYDSHRLYSMHMKYLLCYFRPENHFPNSVFGGFARNNTNPKACSLDAFAYFHFKPKIEEEAALPAGWELLDCRKADIQELSIWYDYQSGGLLLDAVDLEPDSFDSEEVVREYRSLGFTKKRTLFSLKYQSGLKAIIVVHQSDIGLNLSDLTHCVKVLVLDPEDLTTEILEAAITRIFSQQGLREMPVLIYPKDFADNTGITYEKVYNLWIINIRYSDQYFEFLEKLFNRTRKKVPR
ncbi:MAG: hypothetical protein ACOWWM_08155 [Desulfobacterales bacterium]